MSGPRKKNHMTERTNPRVLFSTSLGDFTLELDGAKAPVSTKNFLSYVASKFYDGVIFHRVIAGFMVQCGGFTADMRQKTTERPIANEANNGLKNERGTIAMARTTDPTSATSQFFINLVDNKFLNFTAETPQGWGYAVFGKVTEGMEVVDAIAKVRTGSHGPHQDVPVEPVVINSATLVE
jgi:peptidyl-prolyl cis-trans isomerase B (cyclophilin B)